MGLLGSRGLILIAGMAVPANAQTTGEITGTVTDTSDAVVSGATVIVRNTRTGEERTITTNSLGQYVASALPVSDYEIEVTAAGFKKVRRAGVSLNVATRLADQHPIGGRRTDGNGFR